MKLWMSPWSIDEIKLARASIYPAINEDVMMYNFNHWGGIPRYILKPAKDIKLLDEAIVSCKEDIKTVTSFLGESSASMTISHKILHTHANNFTEKTIRFGSRYIEHKVTTLLLEKNKDAMITFIKDLSPLQASLGGAFFEKLSHLAICDDSNHFTVRPLFSFPIQLELWKEDKRIATTLTDQVGTYTFNSLKEKGPFIIRAPSHDISYTDSLSAITTTKAARVYSLTGNVINLKCHTKRFDVYTQRCFDDVKVIPRNEYCIPTSPTFAYHPTNPDDFSTLIEDGQFKDIDLYFVVTSANFNNFKLQNSYMHKSVRQYALDMTVKNLGYDETSRKRHITN
eukprot:gene13756-16224_t